LRSAISDQGLREGGPVVDPLARSQLEALSDHGPINPGIALGDPQLQVITKQVEQ